LFLSADPPVLSGVRHFPSLFNLICGSASVRGLPYFWPAEKLINNPADKHRIRFSENNPKTVFKYPLKLFVFGFSCHSFREG
jgi:hypothetical protein